MTDTVLPPTIWADEPLPANEVPPKEAKPPRAGRLEVWADDDPEIDDEHVEPRLRARRVEVRRAERRRRRRVLLALVMLLVLSAAAIGSLYSPLLDLDHLDIEGLRHLDPAGVEDASGLATGQQLVDLDTDRAVTKLDALPWVDRVTVTRRWPDTVEVRIVERTAIAVLVPATGERVVVARDGMVAGPAGPLDDDLPAVLMAPALTAATGVRLSDEVTLGLQMLAALPEDLAARATGAVVDESGGIQVVMADDAVLVLGNGEDASAKFIAAESILGGAVALNCLESANVSVPSAPVIVRASGCR